MTLLQNSKSKIAEKYKVNNLGQRCINLFIQYTLTTVNTSLPHKSGNTFVNPKYDIKELNYTKFYIFNFNNQWKPI